MIDKRKIDYDIPKKVKEFIDLLENDNFEVIYIKQHNSKSILKITKDNITMEKVEFSHNVIDSKSYFNWFIKNTWELYKKFGGRIC